MAVLNCENLTLGYDGHPVVQGLSFCVEKGDYLCIVGENGSGKSTLIKTLLGLCPPLSGTIGGAFSNRTIGYLPQQTPVQRDFPASVREIVLSGCLRSFFYTAADRKRAQANMEKMGIADLAARCYRDLSGGQQQRVLLARALCAAKDMLLLDEPVAGLDPRVTRELYELIAGLNREGMTILLVTHDLTAALQYASHILHIGGDRELFFGTAEEYRASEAFSLLARGGEENG